MFGEDQELVKRILKQDIDILKHFRPSDLNIIINGLEEGTADCHEILIEPGQSHGHIYIINEGVVKQYHKQGGNEVGVEIHSKDYIAGLEYVMEDNQEDFYVETLSNVRYTAIELEDIRFLMKMNNDITYDILERMIRRLGAFRTNQVALSNVPVRQRVAKSLLLMEREFISGLIDHLKVRTIDIATLAGTTRESAARMLSEFSKDNLITLEKGEVQIQKHTQLEEIANMYD